MMLEEGFNDNYVNFPGLGIFYRSGYMEKDIVDYNTNNLKLSSSLHYKLNPDIEMMYKFNYGTGTTVYQGDNRFSLKNIQFFPKYNRSKDKKINFLSDPTVHKKMLETVMMLYFTALKLTRA